MVEDTGVLQEIETECLAALEEYDRKYNAGYVETLQSYLKHNGRSRQWRRSCTHTAIPCYTGLAIYARCWGMN